MTTYANILIDLSNVRSLYTYAFNMEPLITGIATNHCYSWFAAHSTNAELFMRIFLDVLLLVDGNLIILLVTLGWGLLSLNRYLLLLLYWYISSLSTKPDSATPFSWFQYKSTLPFRAVFVVATFSTDISTTLTSRWSTSIYQWERTSLLHWRVLLAFILFAFGYGSCLWTRMWLYYATTNTLSSSLSRDLRNHGYICWVLRLLDNHFRAFNPLLRNWFEIGILLK